MQGGAHAANVIQGVIVVTKTAPKKVWTKPTLAPLGTIEDVAAATSAACQVQGNSQCNGSNSVLS